MQMHVDTLHHCYGGLENATDATVERGTEMAEHIERESNDGKTLIYKLMHY
jgi:hypothetical protein